MVAQSTSWIPEGSGIQLWFVSPTEKTAKPILLPGTMRMRNTYSEDGHWLATEPPEEGVVQLWKLDLESRRTEPVVLRARKMAIEALAFSPDSHWLGACGRGIRLWNLDKSNPGAQPIALDTGDYSAQHLAFSADGSWLAADSGGGFEHTASLWSLQSIRDGQDPILLHGHSDIIGTLQFSSDCRWLATASYDRTVRLWNLGQGNPAADPVILRGHEQGVIDLGFSPDGEWLATQDELGHSILTVARRAGSPHRSLNRLD